MGALLGFPYCIKVFHSAPLSHRVAIRIWKKLYNYQYQSFSYQILFLNIIDIKCYLLKVWNAILSKRAKKRRKLKSKFIVKPPNKRIIKIY